ncbi:Protein of unknown function [Bacillus mycoides]|nr:Protein of unknown function [Bacillus mycoides]
MKEIMTTIWSAVSEV